MGNQISTDATGHEGQNRAHVSHFPKVASALSYIT